MIKKNLIIFMPFIGGGGVEKNLFIISDYLCKKFRNIKVCTLSKDKKNKFNKKIKFLEPKNNFSSQLNIRLKYLVCLFILFKLSSPLNLETFELIAIIPIPLFK